MVLVSFDSKKGQIIGRIAQKNGVIRIFTTMFTQEV